MTLPQIDMRVVIWSFLAGFSENFVPTILIRTEAKSLPT